ncbi:hypothetical protein B0O99DRAFT_613940 [Bisporella sp. PMI_857]|nr:hypothetical protein B0O99DRAFT_613940 [Bisporella sp. PMI_857]
MADPPVTGKYTRLHITPLNPNLLPILVPPSILPHAKNISYHNIQTFPDSSYGYIELPTMDATSLTKKLNGSILKGTKIKIETARPKPEFLPAEPTPERPKREKKKRKRDEIPGVEIERNVKRGWTTPGKVAKGDKKKVKSKYSGEKECLFKTVLPANVATQEKGKGKERVVHEFAKREKYMTFLRGPTGEKLGKGVKEYVAGKGWLDDDGEIVEAEVKKRKMKELMVLDVPKTQSIADNPGVASNANNSPNSSGEESHAEEDLNVDKTRTKRKKGGYNEVVDNRDSPSQDISSTSSSESKEQGITTSDSNTSSSGSSSDSDSDSSSSEDESISKPSVPAIDSPASSSPAKLVRPTSSSGLTISIPNSAVTSTPIHPLEALYKKPKGDQGTAATGPSFSFFGNDIDENDDVEREQDTIPFTPFTQREFEFRGQRSAAPTPDTAHANKRFLWPKNNDDEEDDSQDAPSSPIRHEGKGKGKEVAGGKNKEEESDFTKWFYENRGETNRAWKKRRKVVAKEKRQRENRKRGSRA